jgi:hypothetical protein
MRNVTTEVKGNMPRDNGTVRVHTFSREMVMRMMKIVRAQTSENIVVPDELPFKYIVLGSSANPGSPVHYEIDTLLTDTDIQRMINQENLKIIFDKGPWRRGVRRGAGLQHRRQSNG